jgi:tetratricopeptide (TPR) repeat protein
MRAGCFAETRVIHLLNRRFVNFYFNTGGPGLGKDPAAAAFTRGKTKNPVAYYAAFAAGGEPLGVTDVYAAKDSVFDFLVALLRENPEFDRHTKEEEAILARAGAKPGNAAAQLAAGRLLEELGRYTEARPHYRRVLEARGAGPALVGDTFRGLLRMARYSRKWPEVESLAREAERHPNAADLGLAADLAMERGFHLLADKKYGEAKATLEAAFKRHPGSPRTSELRFYAGVACYFLKDVDRASYHWCWVVENLPDDRLVRRCYTAAAHQGMPYANPELGGYTAPLRGGNIGVIQAAYEAARQTYLRLKDSEKGG